MHLYYYPIKKYVESNFFAVCCPSVMSLIIVVIITWPGEKPSPNKNSDITVFRVSDLLKWLMFMQNFEHGVTVFNHLESIICVVLFSVCYFY